MYRACVHGRVQIIITNTNVLLLGCLWQQDPLCGHEHVHEALRGEGQAQDPTADMCCQVVHGVAVLEPGGRHGAGGLKGGREGQGR